MSTAVAIFCFDVLGVTSILTAGMEERLFSFFMHRCCSYGLVQFLNYIVYGIYCFFGVMYFFQGPVMGLADVMVLETDENFASIRLCGAVGYALSVFAGGKIGGLLGLDKIFFVYAVTFVIGGFIVMTIKLQKVPLHKIEETAKAREKIKFSELLKEKKKQSLLIICGIFMFGTNVANNTYFSFLFRDGGGTVAGVGTAFC